MQHPDLQLDRDFFEAKAHHSQPEKVLWCEVLKLALEDLDSPPGENSRWWFKSKATGVGSFLWVCETLGISHHRKAPGVSGVAETIDTDQLTGTDSFP